MSFIDAFNQIDQNPVWLNPYLSIHTALKNELENNNCLDNGIYQWLNHYFNDNNIIPKNHLGNSLSFTHQNDLPHGIAYELFISQNGKIPTRDNLHDWFNACIWSVFKNSKAILNHHHLLHIDKNESGNKRNRVRDAITVFDENGIVLAISNDMIGKQIKESLFNFDWTNALISPRTFWYNPTTPNPNNDNQIHAQAFVFGHALLEQLITPRKNICGHTIGIMVEPEFFNWDTLTQLSYLDNLLAKQLNDWLRKPTATPKDLQPLPVLGIPYFYGNQDKEFYDDTSVFRAGRRTSA